MQNLICPFLLILVLSLYGQQDEEDQNPNHKKVFKKYSLRMDEVNSKQGVTSQQTYTAIDPMEAERKRIKWKKDYSAKIPFWRYQERMEKIKNTKYHFFHENSQFFRDNRSDRCRFFYRW